MEPQARHEKEPWRRHCDDESRRLRFHLQSLRVFLFPTLFFLQQPYWSSREKDIQHRGRTQGPTLRNKCNIILVRLLRERTTYSSARQVTYRMTGEGYKSLSHITTHMYRVSQATG